MTLHHSVKPCCRHLLVAEMVSLDFLRVRYGKWHLGDRLQVRVRILLVEEKARRMKEQSRHDRRPCRCADRLGYIAVLETKDSWAKALRCGVFIQSFP